MGEQKKIYCPYDCPAVCGLTAEISNGRVVSVRADQDHPVSSRTICRKMQHYEESIYSEKRILTPLRRTGKKGEGRFEPISWEAAVKEITDRFKEIIGSDGPEAIWPWTYGGVLSGIQRKCGDAFLGKIGASQAVKSLCSPAKGAAYTSVAGTTGCLDPRELKDSDFYIIWGSNLAATRLQTLADLSGPAGRGKKKVLIDTYAGPTAAHCDAFIPIKAGTDGALALAMMHVLEAEDLTDRAFMQAHTEGYEAFRKTLTAYSPEWAENETGVPAETIRQLARDYAAARAPAIILGSGNSRYRNGGMTVRLIIILSLFTGAWQVPGGGLCGCTPFGTAYVDKKPVQRPDFRVNPARILNLSKTASALAMTGKDAVRALYVYGANPANTTSNQEGVIKGLEREDLFTVVHERFMTETALYADIILPAAFSVEQADIFEAYGYCTLASAPAAVPVYGEGKSNWETFRLLAEAMGFEEPYFKQTEEALRLDLIDQVPGLSDSDRAVLKAGGAVSMPFSDHLKGKTPDGRFLLTDEKLAEPMPRYIRLPDEADLPLRLVAAPSVWTLNSEFRDLEKMVRGRGEQALIMSPEDAGARGIKDGQKVVVYNELARVVFKARVREQTAPGTVVAEGIYRRDDTEGGKTFNALLREYLSDLGKGTTMCDNRVEVSAL